jgi:hypothetical protein
MKFKNFAFILILLCTPLNAAQAYSSLLTAIPALGSLICFLKAGNQWRKSVTPQPSHLTETIWETQQQAGKYTIFAPQFVSLIKDGNTQHGPLHDDYQFTINAEGKVELDPDIQPYDELHFMFKRDGRENADIEAGCINAAHDLLIKRTVIADNYTARNTLEKISQQQWDYTDNNTQQKSESLIKKLEMRFVKIGGITKYTVIGKERLCVHPQEVETFRHDHSLLEVQNTIAAQEPQVHRSAAKKYAVLGLGCAALAACVYYKSGKQ